LYTSSNTDASEEQLADPSNSNIDPNNFLGRFTVVEIKPEPCATGTSVLRYYCFVLLDYCAAVHQLPTPCSFTASLLLLYYCFTAGAAAKLVNTAAKVQSINAQQLSWTAAHRRGTTLYY
jgi:hypothetical protein